MQPITYDSIIDLSTNNNFIQISVCKHDSAAMRKVNLALIAYGQPYNITDDTNIYIVGTKPDQTHVMYPCEYHNHIVTFTIQPQMVTVEGKSTCQLMLTNADGEVLHSFPFYLICTDAFDPSVLVSQDDYELIFHPVETPGSIPSEVDWDDINFETSLFLHEFDEDE